MQLRNSHVFIPFQVNGEYELIVDMNNDEGIMDAWIRRKDGMIMSCMFGLPIQRDEGRLCPLTLKSFMGMAVDELVNGNLDLLADDEKYYAGKWKDGVGPLAGKRDVCDTRLLDANDVELLAVGFDGQQIQEYEIRGGYTVAVSYSEETDRFECWLSRDDFSFKFLCLNIPRVQPEGIYTHDYLATVVDEMLDKDEHCQIIEALLQEEDEHI